VIQPLLPTKVRGVPRADDRKVLNGIFWRLRTGAPWADIPARYGPYTTCVNRFNRWRRPVTGRAFSKRYQPLTTATDDRFALDPRPPERRQWAKKHERSRCMARSRGGLTTKIHALVDAEGRPIRLKLT